MENWKEKVEKMKRVDTESHLQKLVYAEIFQKVDKPDSWSDAEEYLDHVQDDIVFPMYEKNGNIHLYSWRLGEHKPIDVALWASSSSDKFHYSVQVEKDGGLLQSMGFQTLDEAAAVASSLMWTLQQFDLEEDPNGRERIELKRNQTWREPNGKELHLLVKDEMERYGLDRSEALEVVQFAYVRVLENFTSDTPGYRGKMMFVVFGFPETADFFTFSQKEDKLIPIEPQWASGQVKRVN